MDADGFKKFLKKMGKNAEVADRINRLVNVFAEFLHGRGTSLDDASMDDLDAFVTWVEHDQTILRKPNNFKPSAKSYLWAIRSYYHFNQNEEMEKYTALLREARIKRTPFPLKDFRGVDSAHTETLKHHKVLNVNQMLRAGKTAQQRRQLADETGVPESAIEEFVRLSDLARLTGVKAIRARLYHDAGIDSIAKFASLEPEEILSITRKFVEDTGFDGIPPLPGEIRHGNAMARSLPIIVDLD